MVEIVFSRTPPASLHEGGFVYYPTADGVFSVPQRLANVLRQNGVATTPVVYGDARRPTSGLYVGRIIFSREGGVPLWWTGAQWVDGAGAPA